MGEAIFTQADDLDQLRGMVRDAVICHFDELERPRPDGALYSGEVPLARLASAGDASGGRWAISGAAGLYLPQDGDVAPAVTILWCEDVRAVDHLLVGSGL